MIMMARILLSKLGRQDLVVGLFLHVVGSSLIVE